MKIWRSGELAKILNAPAKRLLELEKQERIHLSWTKLHGWCARDSELPHIKRVLERL